MMKPKTQKGLLAVFLVLALIGFFLIFYDLVLALVFLVPSAIAISVLITEESGIPVEWWQFLYLKKRGRTQRKMEREKVPLWYAAWWAILISILVLDVYMLQTIPSVGVLLFFFFLVNLFVMLLHQYGKE